MTTTREEQRDVARDLLSTLAEWHSTIRMWSGSAFVAGEDIGDDAGARKQLYLDLCRIGNETAWMEDEITRLRASQAGGVPAGWMDLIEEIDAELDRQLYDEEYVRQCRNNDLDVPSDCEHHIIIREALRSKIAKAAASPPPPAIDHAGWQDISTAPKDGTYVDIWGVNPAGRRFPGVRWTDWPPVGAVDGFTWRDERGVPVVDHADAVATNWMALPSAPGAPPPATDGALESEGLVQATVQGNGSVTVPACQWQPIETAPEGRKVLVSARLGEHPHTMTARFWPTGSLQVEDEIPGAEEIDGELCVPAGWYEESHGDDNWINRINPTHWMPLPPAPGSSDRTNAPEAQSGSLNQALPASSVSATDAVEAERAIRADEREACAALADPRTGPLTGPSHDRWDRSERDIRTKIAATIRARGTDEVGNG